LTLDWIVNDTRCPQEELKSRRQADGPRGASRYKRLKDPTGVIIWQNLTITERTFRRLGAPEVLAGSREECSTSSESS